MKSTVLAISLFLLTGCGVSVKTIYDHKIDFKSYKTFCWMKGCEFTYSGPAHLMTPEGKEFIQKAIIAEMAAKGIGYDSENPDLLIDLHVTVENEKIETFNHDMIEKQNNRFYNYYDQQRPVEIDLLKGTLVLDIADRKESKMIWRSVAVSYLDIYPEVSAENIRKGIHTTLKKFPPEKAKSNQ